MIGTHFIISKNQFIDTDTTASEGCEIACSD